MFGHDYTQEEQDALDAIREREIWGSISPAGLHNDDRMYVDLSKEIPNDIETIRRNMILKHDSAWWKANRDEVMTELAKLEEEKK